MHAQATVEPLTETLPATLSSWIVVQAFNATNDATNTDSDPGVLHISRSSTVLPGFTVPTSRA